MNLKQQLILAEVEGERDRQDAKGTSREDGQKSVQQFAEYISAYVSWAAMMEAMGSPDKARRRMIQVAAMAVACVEAMDAREGRGG